MESYFCLVFLHMQTNGDHFLNVPNLNMEIWSKPSINVIIVVSKKIFIALQKYSFIYYYWKRNKYALLNLFKFIWEPFKYVWEFGEISF